MATKGSSWLLFGCCLAPLLFGFSIKPQDDPKQWNTKQWETWRDSQIKRILLPEFDASGEKILIRKRVISQSALAYSFLKPLLKDPRFLTDPDRNKVLGNFTKFISAEQRMGIQNSAGTLTNLLAMSVTDREYFSKESRWVAFPELLKSQPFLKSLAKPSLYRNAVAIIERHNQTLPTKSRWIVQPFRAQFVKSVDETTYGRLLVMVPNQKLADGRILDQWIMFALATRDLPPSTIVRSISFIAVLRDPARPGNQGFLGDFMRDRDPKSGQIEIKSNFLLKHSPSQNCYDCHKTAVLPIHPKTTYRFGAKNMLEATNETQNPTLEQLNSLVFQYGKTDFGYLKAGDFGPAIGTPTSSRSDEFIAEATKDDPVSPDSYQRIRAEMNCATCHCDFAKINYPLAVRSDQESRSFEAKKALVRSTIEMGIMPPKNDLTVKERHALWHCLTKEYLDLNSQKGTFIDWLKGQG